MPATTTATQRKALEQRQATTRKALADRRKFLHRMRNKVHQYTGIDMRDQELVRLERENRDVKQALDALYRQEGQASAATKSKAATKRRKRTRGRRRGRSSGSKTTSSRKQLVLGLVLAVAGALAVVKRETIRKQWREWLNQQQRDPKTSTKDNNSRFPSSSTQQPRRQSRHTLSKVTLRFMGPYNPKKNDRNTSTTHIAEYLQKNHIHTQLVCYSANANNRGSWYDGRPGGANQAEGANRLHQMYGVEAGNHTSKTVDEAYKLITKSLNELFEYAIQHNIDTIWHPGTQSSSTYYGGRWKELLPDPQSHNDLMRRLEEYFKQQSSFTIVDFNTLGSKNFFDMHSSSPNPNKPLQVDMGSCRGRPKYKRTAVIVLSALDTGKPWVILARKCFGPNKPTHPLGERDQVGHRLYNNPTLKQHNQGAAGTKEKYWGTWGTFGGGNDTHAKNNLHAGKLEVIEEAALGAEGTQIVNGFIFHHSFVISGTMCYVAECRDISQFTYLDKTDKNTKKRLIFSSKGEIAELRKVRLLDIRTFDRDSRDIHGGKGVASYALKSITEHVIPWYKKYSRPS